MGRKLLLGPGPGFEPGLGDPQPERALFAERRQELTEKFREQNVAIPTFVHKRADDNQYIITKRHLEILLLELKANNVAEHHLKFVNRVVHKFLNKATQHGDYWSFTVEDLISHLQELQKQYSPSMYRKHITYLKKLFRIADIPLEHNLKSPRYVGVDIS